MDTVLAADKNENAAGQTHDTHDRDALTTEIVQMLYVGSTSALVMALVVSALLVYSLSDIIHVRQIVAWSGIVLLTYTARKLLTMAYHRRSHRDENAQVWLQRFRIATGFCGIAWGLAGLLLFPHNTEQQAFLIFVLAGVLGGGITVYSIDNMTAVSYAAGTLLLAIPRFLINNDVFSVTLGIMLVLYVVYVMLAGRRAANSIRENILLRVASARSKQELAVFAQRQKLHIESTPMGVIEWDVDSRAVLWNSAAENIFGYSSHEALGRHISFIVHPTSLQQLEEAVEAILSGQANHNFVHENLRQDGEIIHCEWLNTPLKNPDGSVVGWASLVQDKTAFKKAQEEVYQLAYFDVLTNLPNRRLLLDRLSQALIASKRAESYGAVIFLDLDNFKTLNDTKGHAVGDLLLREVAARLHRSVRENDTVARIGGDEFVLVLSILGQTQEQAQATCHQIAEKVIQEINRPYHLNAHEHHSSASVGVCLFLGQELSVDEVLKRADTAMYQAKQAGRNNMQFFNASLQPALDLRARLQNDLRLSLVNEELVLFYQVQVDHQFNISGAEVLIRWMHPEMGLVSPAEFIPLAEDSGQIIPIGTWVLREACQRLKTWEASKQNADLRLSVNVSARQFGQSDFVNQVSMALSIAGCQARLLRLELTESLVLQNIEDVVSKMRALKELGVSLAMDDFGTGYSSLSVLRYLPLDELKIDQGFVRELLVDSDDMVIVQTIIAMGKNLGMEVIAEGVETQEQAALLQKFGCMAYQGYLFGKPMPIGEFEANTRLALKAPPAMTPIMLH
jgi:diguanylate cyclase (GGDEF)-like protein/PAS domain S-box-containing protein